LPFEKRRCLVPASGFYEFQATKTVKNRLRFSVAGDNYFSFAGFWNRFSDDLSTFTFITTEPSEWFSQFHNRQAVILRPDDYDRWLDSRATVESLKGLLVPWREELKAEPAPKGG
jgi:putative SOS response-associated peptidase YedK